MARMATNALTTPCDLAMNLAKREGVHLRVFLMGDGVQCAVR